MPDRYIRHKQHEFQPGTTIAFFRFVASGDCHTKSSFSSTCLFICFHANWALACLTILFYSTYYRTSETGNNLNERLAVTGNTNCARSGDKK